MNLDQIQTWGSTDFFEWGIQCAELNTDSTKVPGVSPIASVSFAWNTVQPELSTSLMANTTKRTYGVGQCKFEMYNSSNRCKVQDAFKTQTVLPKVTIIGYVNVNGQQAESEKYVFTNVTITNYSVESKSNQLGQVDKIGINSTSHTYIQIVRDPITGNSLGNIVSARNSS